LPVTLSSTRCRREAAQAGGAGGDSDGQIEGEEGFAAFGLAADDADGFTRHLSVID